MLHEAICAFRFNALVGRIYLLTSSAVPLSFAVLGAQPPSGTVALRPALAPQPVGVGGLPAWVWVFAAWVRHDLKRLGGVWRGGAGWRRSRTWGGALVRWECRKVGG